MPASRQARPRTRPLLVPQSAAGELEGTEALERAIDALQEKTSADERATRSIKTVDLVIGENRIVHGLGHKARGCSITPTIASAAFAWSLATDGDRVAVITVVGLDMPGATVELW